MGLDSGEYLPSYEKICTTIHQRWDNNCVSVYHIPRHQWKVSPNKSLYFWEIGENFWRKIQTLLGWKKEIKYYPEFDWPVIASEKHNPQFWYIKNRCRKLLKIEDSGKQCEIEISDRKTRGKKARCMSTRCEASLPRSPLLDFLGISKTCLSLHNTSVSKNHLYRVTQSTLIQYFVVGRRKQRREEDGVPQDWT